MAQRKNVWFYLAVILGEFPEICQGRIRPCLASLTVIITVIVSMSVIVMLRFRWQSNRYYYCNYIKFLQSTDLTLWRKKVAGKIMHVTLPSLHGCSINIFSIYMRWLCLSLSVRRTICVLAVLI